MDHLDRNVQRRLAGDENDPPPSALPHPRHVVTRQADTAHDIGIEIAMPIRVSDRLERRRFENSEIVHQDIGIAGAPQKIRHAIGAGEIGGDPFDAATGNLLQEPLLCGLHAVGAAPIDDDRRAAVREPARDREADTGGRTRHDRSLAAQIDDHAASWR